MNATFSINEKHDGIEIYFTTRPPDVVLEYMKARKFRWHNQKRCWYNRRNEETIAIAEMLQKGVAI